MPQFHYSRLSSSEVKEPPHGREHCIQAKPSGSSIQMGSMYWEDRLPSRTCIRTQRNTREWTTWSPPIGMTERILAIEMTCRPASSSWKSWAYPASASVIWWSMYGTCGESGRGSRRMTRRRSVPMDGSRGGSRAAIVMGSWTSARTIGCRGSRPRRKRRCRWRWRRKSRTWRGCGRREWGRGGRVFGGGRGGGWDGGGEIEGGRRPWSRGEKTRWSPMIGWCSTGNLWLQGAPSANRLMSGSSFPSSTKNGLMGTIGVRWWVLRG